MGEDEKEEKNAVSLNVELGKNIDAALGDVIRSLLTKPAEAVGDLTSDVIGILGDRVKRKRELNAKIGLEEVRKKLEDANIEMKDITPPKEEELHLLINGLSLSDDEKVRDMWAGLFAKALEPDSKVEAERPFLSVLESLSPMDAKIIDFLAFLIKTDTELIKASKSFQPKDSMNITSEEAAKIEILRKENIDLRKKAIEAIKNKAEEYGLATLSDSSWSDNLIRQGVIERVPVQESRIDPIQVRSLDERAIMQVLERLNRQMNYLDQRSKRRSSAPKTLFAENNQRTVGVGPQIQLEVQLSAFGKRLAAACGLLG